ncbi:MAG TPA: enoyl-CoA hydratase/isomerase family protein [Alphaproteobacteria bacterium]|nr:enoyl-CoA hydratase/isomerase family protein [Alphaproteobacteria bacterium]
MSKNLIDIEVIEPRILSVTIKNHKKRNALSDSIKKELEKIALDLRDNTEIVGVILSGEKGVFSSGNDLKDKNAFGEGLDLLKARQQNRLGLRMCNAWNNLPQITIASIEGACIGGGVSIALSCDFRFCSVNAYFHAPEVDLGITYSWGSIPKLVSLVGPSKAKLFALACKKLDSSTSLQWGLCDEIAKNPFTLAKQFLLDLSKKPIVAQQMVKESINRQVNINEVSIFEQDQVLLTRKN